jgi:hypothetical protein
VFDVEVDLEVLDHLHGSRHHDVVGESSDGRRERDEA